MADSCGLHGPDVAEALVDLPAMPAAYVGQRLQVALLLVGHADLSRIPGPSPFPSMKMTPAASGYVGPDALLSQPLGT